MQSQRLRQTQDLKIHKIQNTKNTENTVITATTAITAKTTTAVKGKAVQGMNKLQMIFLPHHLTMFRNRKRTAEVLKLPYMEVMIETYALEFFAQK
jgi:hypothetical protein